MQLTETQENLLRELLRQFVTDFAVDAEELSATYAYLFGHTPIVPFFTDKELFETIGYLRDTIVAQQLPNLEETIRYYEQKKRKMRNFLTAYANDSPPPASEKALQIGDPIRVQPMDNGIDDPGGMDFLSQQLGQVRRMIEQLYTTISLRHSVVLVPTDGGGDLLSAVRKHVQSLLQANKPTAVHYRLSAQGSIAFSMRRYLEQFSDEPKEEQVFILQFKKHSGAGLPALVCEHSESIAFTFHDAVTTYFNRSQPPDYASIIEVIRKEMPIADNEFKIRLTEWLVYSKMMNRLCHVESPKQQAVHAQQPPPNLFLGSDTFRYYGKGEMHYWIHDLFETRLSYRKWVILKSTPGNFWLTSDNPGFLVNMRELTSDMVHFTPKQSLLDFQQDSTLYYPLSKDYCLRIQPNARNEENGPEDIPIEFELSSESELNFVNGVTVSTHNEMVIATQKKALQQIQSTTMAKNGKVGDGHRNGQVTKRSQTHNPKNDTWVKRDTDTGQFMDQKADGKPFKGVRKEK